MIQCYLKYYHLIRDSTGAVPNTVLCQSGWNGQKPSDHANSFQ